jgi:solute carrier family 25 uncoupling protein 8/9
LYNGLAAGLQRQMAFSAIRIGAYETVKKTYQDFTGCEFLLFPFKTNVTCNTGIPPSGLILFLFLNSHVKSLSVLDNSGAGFLFVRIAAGATTGTLAILAAQPTDVVKIRMQVSVSSLSSILGFIACLLKSPLKFTWGFPYLPSPSPLCASMNNFNVLFKIKLTYLG